MKKHISILRWFLVSTVVTVVMLGARPLANPVVEVSDLNDQQIISNEIKKTESTTTEKSRQDISESLQRAPAQAAMKAKTPEEKRYYLLSTPNDPFYSQSWFYSVVNAPAAWQISSDSSDITIAVLDSGFALNHQDLQARWLYNSAECGDGKESNGIDDDGNGYIDDCLGWDFFSIDNSPQTGEQNPAGDGVSHGTEVAGLAGATSDNNLGVASLARNPNLLPLQVMSDEGSGYSSDIAAAIYYAAGRGVDVINMSLGTSGDDSVVRDAIDYAISQNIVVVAAAGNCGNNSEGVCANQPAGIVTFPASYDRVIAVGATNISNVRASFSSYGQRLDMMAPGSGTLISPSWSAGNQTTLYAGTLHGTSYSSPIVASAAALLRSIRPNSSVDDIRALLMGSTQTVAAMNGVFYTSNYGHGLLNIGKTLTVARDLNLMAEETKPVAYQGGNVQTEKRYRSTDQIGSGCEVVAQTWCTLWLRNTTQNYDRFLPYGKTNINDEFGWTWSGSVLQRGEWEIRGRQGDSVSDTSTLLFSK